MNYNAKRTLLVRIVAGVCAFLLLGSVLLSVLTN